MCGTATKHALQVRSKHKYFIGLQLRYPLRREIRALNSIIRSHIAHEVTKNYPKLRNSYGSVTMPSWL